MSTDAQAGKGEHDIGGMVIAVVFIGLACLALWDTTHMADSDSYVFPRTVAGGMILFSLALIAWNLIRPAASGPLPRASASTPRRVGLVATMLIGAALMPYLGFLLSGLLAFGALTMIAMYDAWTPYRRVLYPIVGVAIVVGFYMLFAQVLQVPLPTSEWFS